MAAVLEDLALSVIIGTPGGGSIELEDPDGGYEIHADSFATAQVTHRKIETNSQYAEGTFAVDAVRDNTTEALVVWVTGINQHDFRIKCQHLTDCLDQVSFPLQVTIGDAVVTWDCEVSDYTLETQQEFWHATTGVVRATVPRRPAVAYGFAVGTPLPDFWRRAYLATVLGLDTAVPFAPGNVTADALAGSEQLAGVV